ncbi:MAG TPA: hypothetical protein VMK66_21880 [Myxococcales bacterium]|nr:hypothetical protein [Myxococcales bacterium]
MKAAFQRKLEEFLAAAGLSRVHPEAVEPTARAVVEALAGLPHYDQVWAGDLETSVQVIVVASGERVPGVEFARRAQMLRERALSLGSRVKGEVQVLQLALYSRSVPEEERQFVIEKGRVAGRWPLARGRVATWVVSLSEPALHAGLFRGWPQALSADQLRALLA